MSDEIIVHGAPMHVPGLIVHTWRETGMQFLCSTRKTTRAVVNHWTGAENPAASVFTNLRNHRNNDGRPEPLSVHFAVEATGEVWQFCDTQARCSHAAGLGANNWSIGIEIINRGTNERVGHDVPRDMRTDIIHGKLVRYRMFTAAQIESVCLLNLALCEAYDLPCHVPQRQGDVHSTVLPAEHAQRVTGVLGHYMVEPSKYDPGPELLRIIHARGAGADPRVA